MLRTFNFLIAILLVSLVYSCRDSDVAQLKEKPAPLFYSVKLNDVKESVENGRKSGRLSDKDFWGAITPVWNAAYEEENELGKFYIIPTQHSPYEYLVKNDDGSFEERQSQNISIVSFKNKNGEVKSYYFVAATDGKIANNNDWIKSFTGSIVYYEMTGKLKFRRSYLNGKRLFTVEELPGGPSKSGRCDWAWSCFYTSPSAAGTSVYGHYTEGPNCPGSVTFNGHNYALTDRNRIYKCDDGTTTFLNVDELPIPFQAPNWIDSGAMGALVMGEDDIKPQLSESPCATAVLSELRSKLPNQNGIAGFINNFAMKGNALSKFNLTIKIEDLTNANGVTRINADMNNKDVTIALDRNYLTTATKLSIARTILHESLHAYIGSYLKANGEANFRAAFPDALILYRGRIATFVMNQHDLIADYVGSIATALKDYDDNAQPYSYYVDLAWAGLADTPEFGIKSQPEKTWIMNILFNERTGNASSKGKKCN